MNSLKDNVAVTLIVDIQNSGEKPCDYVLPALRKVAKEFLATAEGRRVLEENNGDFNWGDLVDVHIPDYIWAKHDLYLVDSFATSMCVDHDENLNN